MANNTPYFGEFAFKTFGINATADWSGTDSNGLFQFRAVVIDASNVGNVLIASSQTVPILGIMVNAPRLNESAQIVVMGETKVLAGAAISNGDQLSIDTHGRVITAASGDIVIGFARMPANAAGDLITAVIVPNFTTHA